MKPEEIGIQDLLKSVYARPNRFAELVARMTVSQALKALKDEEHRRASLSDDKKKDARPLNLTRLMAHADEQPTHRQIASVKRVVMALISEHQTGTLKGPFIDNETRDAIARTCMALLGDYLITKGHSDLGHFIHSTSHIEKLLSHPERLAIMEHDIIPDNCICPSHTTADDQIWMGHDTYKGYQGQSKKRNNNVILHLSRKEENTDNSGRPDYHVEVLLKGDLIHYGLQTIVFSEKQAHIYGGPTKSNDSYSFTGITSLPITLDEIGEVESELVQGTKWHMHRVSGNIQTRDESGVGEDTTTATKLTLCVHSDQPELSFTTTSKRYRIGKVGFVVDTEKSCLQVLHTTGIQTFHFKFNNIRGTFKYENVEGLYFVDKENKYKKIILKDEQLTIIDLDGEEKEELFPKKKK